MKKLIQRSITKNHTEAFKLLEPSEKLEIVPEEENKVEPDLPQEEPP